MNSEIISLKQKSIDVINSKPYHENLVVTYDKILSDFNPEMAEKQAQQQEITELRNQMNEMSRNMALLIEQLKEDKNRRSYRNMRDGMSVEEAYECGYEDGYEDAMEESEHGMRSYRSSSRSYRMR